MTWEDYDGMFVGSWLESHRSGSVHHPSGNADLPYSTDVKHCICVDMISTSSLRVVATTYVLSVLGVLFYLTL